MKNLTATTNSFFDNAQIEYYYDAANEDYAVMYAESHCKEQFTCEQFSALYDFWYATFCAQSTMNETFAPNQLEYMLKKLVSKHFDASTDLVEQYNLFLSMTN